MSTTNIGASAGGTTTDGVVTTNKLTTTTEPVDALVSFLERAARDPTIDVGKLERLLSMKERLDEQERRREFFDALARLQARIAPIAKSGTNTHTGSRYVRLDDLLIVIRPLLGEEGFSFTFDSEPSGTGIAYTCALLHRGGHSETRRLVLPVDGAGSHGGASAMNVIQAVGSSTSYARRYLIEMHLNLARRDEDDDGNGGPRCVTAEQAAEIRSKLTAAKGNEARFLNWAAAASFEQIPAGNFARCLTAIEVIAQRART